MEIPQSSTKPSVKGMKIDKKNISMTKKIILVLTNLMTDDNLKLLIILLFLNFYETGMFRTKLFPGWESDIDGLMQDCSNSIANALELLQCKNLD